MKISQELKQTLYRVIAEKYNISCSILLEKNIYNILRLLFKRNITISKMVYFNYYYYQHLGKTIIENVNIDLKDYEKQATIYEEKYNDGLTYKIPKEYLRDDVSGLYKEQIDVNYILLDDDFSISGHQILTDDETIIICPKEDTVEGINELLKSEGRLSEGVEINTMVSDD